ncbi:MFS transporter [Kitasatospora sp. NPDC002040]|uniref:MFS transporter n=1 Tax=Kitasatospora sp. NPDC002040 TaxID=3154661 RepID=UPI0033226794
MRIEDPTADGRRWSILAVGLLAITVGCTFQFGLPYLIPALRADGMSLGTASTLAACPTFGALLTLYAWGAAADRWGERLVLVTGLALAGLLVLAATRMHSTTGLGACLALAGAAVASVHASSGRLILGWFAARERGLAMGIRQTGQPLGVAVAGLTVPVLAVYGRGSVLTVLGTACLAAAALVALTVRDPPRRPAGTAVRSGSPYRTPVLWRIHAASALLVVPQFTVATFALVFLVDQHGWQVQSAGRLLAVAQIGGAVARLAVGSWSDRVGSRMRPMAQLTAGSVVIMACLTVGACTGSVIAVPALVLASVVTVSTNGLAFTAVAELAGGAWAGRALGIQNTAQNVFASATPSVVALLVTGIGYGPAFAAVTAFPLLAVVTIPLRSSK